MPKKKKTKETAAVEYRFDYRYTPKPYFSADSSASPVSGPSPSASRQANAWKTPQHNGYGSSRSYAKAITGASSSGPSSTTKKPSPVESVEVTTDSPSQKDQTTMKRMFEEMFKGRIETNVIDMVLQDVNWNENQALDVLSQLAPQDNSHLHTASRIASDLVAGTLGGYGALTPDHNLTPTAPTLSYCSSMTSLDEYGLEYCRDQTQRNLSQVADVLRNGPDDINDLDRQRLARSRATTPRTLLRNGNLTSKNISLGSTESLESNRSHEPGGLTFASSGTPKKTNFDKTMSLHDIPTTSVDDIGISLSLDRDQGGASLETAVSDPVGHLVIPIDHGDIVLEKGTYDSLLYVDNTRPLAADALDSSGPLSHSASISDYSEAISSLTTQLHTDRITPNSAPSLTESNSAVNRGDIETASHNSQEGAKAMVCPDIVISEAKTLSDTSQNGNSLSYSAAAVSAGHVTNQQSRQSNKENQYPYNGILTSGKTVPTPFESARPKKPKAKLPAEESMLSSLQEVATSGHKVMFIMRGISGSGKTSFGRQLLERTEGQMFSADDYFINARGEYSWSHHLLPEAHASCQAKARKAAEAGVTPVVIDNTNLQMFEMEIYIKLCLQFGYRPILVEPETAWRYKAKDLARKNVHNVSYVKIKQMLERFDHSVTVQQLIDSVTAKDPSLSSMAEHIKSSPFSSKLSRKKPASKTIKRNKQYGTVEKLKDKKVDELTHQVKVERSSARSKTPVQKDSGDEDNQVETEIMYPNTSISGLRRKSTVKVLNCDKPIVSSNDSAATSSKEPVNVKSVKVKRMVHSKSELLYASKAPSSDKSESTPVSTPDLRSNTCSDLSSLHPTKPLDQTAELATDTQSKVLANSQEQVLGDTSSNVTTLPTHETTSSSHELLVTPIVSSQSDAISEINECIPVESGLNKPVTIPDQSPSTSNHSDLSKRGKEDNNQTIDSEVVKPVLCGSSTLPRPMRSSSTADAITSLPQSASLPRTKTKGNRPKKSQSSLLNVDSETMSRWMSSDWAAPPYPLTALDVTVDPPPPYEEIDTTVNTHTQVPPLVIKQSEAGTLTEPADYAMAYKAMQYNRELPQGWRLVIGKSKDPFPSSPVDVHNHSSVITHDKSTIMTEEERPALSTSSSTDESTEDQINRLHTCFPQIPKDQLAEFLELCQGDETWATNLLLDSNKVGIPKAKRILKRGYSVPDSTRLRPKYKKSSKSGLMKRVNQALSLPAKSCFHRRRGESASSSLRQDVVPFSLTSEQANSLHSLFGKDAPAPSIGTKPMTVDIPRWIAHRLYRCIMSSASLESPLSEPTPVPDTSGLESEVPQPPPRLRKSSTYNTSHVGTTTDVCDGVSASECSVGAKAMSVPEEAVLPADGTVTSANDTQVYITNGSYSLADTALAGWSLVDPQRDTAGDEDLARKLQAEDLLRQSSTPAADHLSVIADEQFARSLAAADANAQNNNDLSSKLKRQQLAQHYPQVDPSFLDEVYSACGNNLERSLNFLSEHRGPEESKKFSIAEAKAGAKPDSVSGSSRESTPARSITGADTEDEQWFDMDEYKAKAGYSEYRAEALIHQNERKKLLEKAEAANRKRMPDVGAHYSRMAELQRQKEQEANFQAAVQIFKDNNSFRDKSEVDLHGLHPTEAVHVVDQVIRAKREDGKCKHIRIITGRGNRSKGGVARVKQAVQTFLNQHRIIYYFENPGLIKVTL